MVRIEALAFIMSALWTIGNGASSVVDILLAMTATLVMAAHLICVNIAAVGPLACIGLARRARRTGDGGANDLARWLALLCNKLLLLGMVLGALQFLIIYWQGQSEYFDALGRMPKSRLHWGTAELLFYFVCMLPYALMWQRLSKRPLLHAFLAVMAATNLLYHFPPLFIIISQLAYLPNREVVLDGAGFRAMMVDPAVLSRVSHHLLAAVAITSAVIMWRAAKRDAVPNDEEAAGQEWLPIARVAAWWALGATAAQIPSGIWLTLNLAESRRSAVLGDDLPATSLFLCAMAGALMLLHHLAAVALGETERRSVRKAFWLLVLVLVLMNGVLQRLTDV